MVGLLDVLQEDAATVLVPKFYQLLSVLLLLVGLVEEVNGKILQRYIIWVKVVRHAQVDTGGIELQLDLAVDGGL